MMIAVLGGRFGNPVPRTSTAMGGHVAEPGRRTQRRILARARGAFSLTVVILSIGTLASAGCRKSPAGTDAAAKSADRGASVRSRLNVILISMDTTRADHLACYGHPFIRTPNIDRLASEGTLFLQCNSSAPLTLPSHCTMMTGTYPPVHRVRDNGTFMLNPGNLTLAETLKEIGYSTAAEVASFILNREFGLNQGFEVYNDRYSSAPVSEDENLFMDSRPAENVCESALAWLHSGAKEPFFLFVHFFDAHQPYDSPERFKSRYAEKYVAAIAYVDEQVGRLLTALQELKLDGRTLVVLTADHGEGRGQHGEETHATFIYDSTMAVPLIVRCPGVIPAGQRIEAQVRLVDIAPTILDVLAVDPLPDAEGISLMPLISGQRKDLHLAAYGESLYPMYDFGMSPLRSLRKDGWKYILAPKPELYHLAVDPQEMKNLVADDPDRAARMREELRKLVADMPAIADVAETHIELTPQAAASLRSLGYVGNPGGATSQGAGISEMDLFEPRGADPKDHRDLIDLVAVAVGLVHQNSPDAAKALRECIAKAPNPDAGFGWAYSDLAHALVAQGQYDEAIQWFRKAMEAAPNDSRAVTALGDALARRGQLDDAIGMFELALNTKPVFAQTYVAFGATLAAKGKPEEAIEKFRTALQIDPKLAYVYRGLANAYLRMGRSAEAIDACEQGLRLASNQPELQRALADLLTSLGRPQEALSQYRKMLDKDPNNAALHRSLADAYAAMQQPDQALAEYRRAIEIAPAYIPASQSLSVFLIGRGQFAEAIQVLKKALALAPTEVALANNLAWLLATAPDPALRDGKEAVRLAEKINESPGNSNPELLDTLAAAYAEVGRFSEAEATAARAIELASKAGDEKTAAAIREHLALYKKQQPYRQQ